MTDLLINSWRITDDGTYEQFAWGVINDPDFPDECCDGYSWAPTPIGPDPAPA